MIKQRGFTLLELFVVLVTLALLAAVLLPSMSSLSDDGKVTASLEQAKNVLSTCEIARKKAVSGEVSADPYVVKNNYNIAIDWTDSSQLKKFVSDGTFVPLTNAFNKPIMFRFDSERCYAAVDVPIDAESIQGYPTSKVGTLSRIVLSSRRLQPNNPGWVNHQQRVLYNETAR